MSGLRGIGIGTSLVVAFTLAGGPASAVENACANGAVNVITSNYGGGSAGLTEEGNGLATRCEICLSVSVQEPGAATGWEQVASVCNIWNDAQAHDVMFKIGQCGLIVPEFERAGRFYGAAVPLRIEAVRQACR